jgi:hypothetical protein
LAVSAVAPGRAGPRWRGVLLVLVAVVVSAAAASATAVALGSRSDLAASRRRVDRAWLALRPGLDARYQALGGAATVARERLGAGRALFDDVGRAVADWPGTARSATDRQVEAAAALEGLAARLEATVAATARLREAPDVTAALGRLRSTDTAAGRGAYNRAVAAYQRARGGFPRRLVAGALGYADRRTLETPA